MRSRVQARVQARVRRRERSGSVSPHLCGASPAESKKTRWVSHHLSRSTRSCSICEGSHQQEATCMNLLPASCWRDVIWTQH